MRVIVLVRSTEGERQDKSRALEEKYWAWWDRLEWSTHEKHSVGIEIGEANDVQSTL